MFKIETKALSFGGLTATIALLSGLSAAVAQSTPPAGSAPGGGAFPGSFLVPGTNTSIGFHGFIEMDYLYDMSAKTSEAGANAAPVLDGRYGLAESTAHVLHGASALDARNSRLSVETRTPTGFGELKTFIELDFFPSTNTGFGSSATQAPCCSNSEPARLRHAYGTLGPLLGGQTWSNFIDLDSFPDVIDTQVEAGMMNAASYRIPQIRYTFLAGNGISLSASVEEPITEATVYNFTSTASATLSASTLNSQTDLTELQRVPALVGTARIDQGWGDLALHGVVQQLRLQGYYTAYSIASSGTATASSINIENGGHLEKTGWGVSASGHLNTWGKDALRGGFSTGSGIGNYLGDAAAQSLGMMAIMSRPSLGGGTGTYPATSYLAAVTTWYTGYASYQHFWAPEWRSTISGGFSHMERPDETKNPYFNGGAGGPSLGNSLKLLATLTNNDYSAHANLIYSPVPQVDLGLEWQYWVRNTLADVAGHENRLDLDFKYKF